MRGWWTVVAGLAFAASGAWAAVPDGTKTMPQKAETPVPWEWTARCVFASKAQRCAMQEDIPSADGKTLLARLEVWRIGGVDTLFVTVPYNVLLDAGVAIGIEGQKPIVFAFDYCNELGCVAHPPVTDDVAKVLGSSRPDILVAGLDGEAAKLPFAGTGFAQAWRRYHENEPADGTDMHKPPADTGRLLNPYAN
jgi:invasion protein IalB